VLLHPSEGLQYKYFDLIHLEFTCTCKYLIGVMTEYYNTKSDITWSDLDPNSWNPRQGIFTQINISSQNAHTMGLGIKCLYSFYDTHLQITVGSHYTAVCYNTKSDITWSDLDPDSWNPRRHFYTKWHEICH